MKNLIILMLFISLKAFSQKAPKEKLENKKQSPILESKIIDLVFFPNIKKYYFSAGYSQTILNQETNIQSRGFSERKLTFNNFQYQMLYGFSSKWAGGIGIEYETNTDRTSYGIASANNGLVEVEKSKGFEDPIFAFIYNPMGIDKNEYNMNFAFTFAPKIQKAKHATTSKDGNSARGNTALSTEINWGKKGSFSWAWTLGLIYEGEEKSVSSENTNSTIITSSYMSILIENKLQWILSSKYSIDLFSTFYRVGDYEIKYSNGTEVFLEGISAVELVTNFNIELQEQTYLIFSIKGGALSELESKRGNQILKTDTDYSGIGVEFKKQF